MILPLRVTAIMSFSQTFYHDIEGIILWGKGACLEAWYTGLFTGPKCDPG